jgi:signal transduction histidine kinase
MESIRQILRAGWHLLKLINEILDLAKVESGQVPMSKEPVSLAEVMLECQGMTETQAQQHGIHMTFPQFEIQYFVTADRTRLKQVIINLLSNAIKYNKKQGSVDLNCTESRPGYIRVSIRDTGAGLKPEQLAQLFQAFNRPGQEAGGEEGTVGVGSVFWFELPKVAEPHLSMMESQGVAGRIQVTDATRQRLNDSFMLEERGTIDVKGKGEMHPWFLNSRNC